ncbi:MAG TPA: hypothetical protein VEK37_07020, partial [Gemmatimonadaceae bacterium]|nr:hypothetical protein [Gemmatimonadaceae bacterium]
DRIDRGRARPDRAARENRNSKAELPDPPNQEYECEHMTFNPWNCLEQHRPLGSINRMRLAVYLASLQVRQKLNMVAS